MTVLFLCGPGSVGKSTVAPHVAAILGWNWVDCDSEFTAQIGDIGHHIATYGYDTYARDNAELTRAVLLGRKQPSVIATSSGFLVHEGAPDVALMNLELVRGRAVVMLPAMTRENVDLIVKRQLVRHADAEGANEREKFQERAAAHARLDLPIVDSDGEPACVAARIVAAMPYRPEPALSAELEREAVLAEAH